MSRHRRPLDAAELADAAITAALLATLLALELVLASSGFFPVLMATVVALLAARRRTRVVVMATAGAAALSVLLGGILPIAEVVLSGLLGWSVGTSLWRGRSRLATAGTALAVTWPVLAGASLAVLAVFGELRDLALDAARNQWDGMARFLRWAGLDTVAEDGTKIVDWSIYHWYVLFPAAEAVLTVLLALIVRSLARVVLVRVEQAIGPATAAATAEPAAGTTAGPVPIRLGDVTVARGQTLVRLGALDTTVARGELVCLVGTNGSGKTSLLRALAGLHPATGISSAGRVGLGEHGGTALISQRAETQVLGIRVIDDLRWGVPGLDDTDALAELARVGLDQLIERPTTDLSGGELQRLAIASALVRRPALLLSDEATAMLDPEGRRRVMAALTAASRTDAAVLHSTHVPADLEATDRVIEVGQAHTRPPPRRWGSAQPAGDTILRAEGVAHVHGARTPWATPALA
ncbi:MAG: DUF2232 domain-containing protein, partial [Acidimicrobiales bacterium]|nr:DUF2232 domain-containing protein [Acidimicrobiales bacterium]